MFTSLDFTEDEIASATSDGAAQQMRRILRFCDYRDGEELAVHGHRDEFGVRRVASTGEAVAIAGSNDAVFVAPNGIATPPSLRPARPAREYCHGDTGLIRVLQIGCTSSEDPTRAFSCARGVFHRFARILKSRRALALGRRTDGGDVLVALDHFPESDQVQMLLRGIGASVASGFSQDWAVVCSSVHPAGLTPGHGFICDNDVARLTSGDVCGLHDALAARYKNELLSLKEAIRFAEQALSFTRRDDHLMKARRPFLATLKRLNTRCKKTGDAVYLDAARAADFDQLVGECLRDRDSAHDAFESLAKMADKSAE